MSSALLLIIMSGLLVTTSLYVFTPSLHSTVISLCSHAALGMCQ